MLTLVLLPGLDGTGRFFWRLERELQGHIPVQVINYPDQPIASYEDAIAYVQLKLPHQPLVILGESFSGPVATEIAARQPDLIKGLILAATFLENPWPRWLIRSIARYSPEKVPPRMMCWALHGNADDPELNKLLREIVAGLPPAVRASRLRAVGAADARQAFLSVNCPVLALHGRDDWLVPKRSMEQACQAKPNASLKLLAGAHMLLQRNAPEAATAILAFMRSLESSKT
jgi:pimeloyl-ACP methyl ester carboxylesterase